MIFIVCETVNCNVSHPLVINTYYWLGFLEYSVECIVTMGRILTGKLIDYLTQRTRQGI